MNALQTKILFTIGRRITHSDQIITEFKWLMKLIWYIILCIYNQNGFIYF